MSDLTALQPTIFFATCTLKGLAWIPVYLIPEAWLASLSSEDETDVLMGVTSEMTLMEDHHLLLVERICHYTNIFALVGMLSFYAVNPRLWNYRHYGWLLLALLVCQHAPQQLRHDGVISWLVDQFQKWKSSSSASTNASTLEGDDDLFVSSTDTTTSSSLSSTLEDVLQTNRIFSTIGVILWQSYSIYYGHVATLQRLVAEPLFVYLTLLTIALETHLTCLSVWMFQTSHLSTQLSWEVRVVLCALFGLVIIVASPYYYYRHHAAQAKILRKQLKSSKSKSNNGSNNHNKKSNNPKMKFV